MIGAYSEMLPSTVEASTAIRKRLKETSPGIEVFFNSLDLGRFPGKAHEERMARFLAEKYVENRPDVIVALGAASLRYLLQYRDCHRAGHSDCLLLQSSSTAAAAMGASRPMLQAPSVTMIGRRRLPSLQAFNRRPAMSS